MCCAVLCCAVLCCAVLAFNVNIQGFAVEPVSVCFETVFGRVLCKRVMSTWLWWDVQMAAQMKQLEQRLMALRAELREKENKARQAEGSVRDLKLQLDDLQVCNLPVMLVSTQTGKRIAYCLCWPRLYHMHSV